MHIFSLCSHKDANLLVVLVFRLPAGYVSAASNASANDPQEERIMTMPPNSVDFHSSLEHIFRNRIDW